MKNYVVVAIDAQLRDHLTARGINVYYKDIQVGRLRLRASTCPVCVLRLQLLLALGTLHGVAEQPLPPCQRSREYQHRYQARAGGAEQGAVA